MVFYYHFFGIDFASQIKFPQLKEIFSLSSPSIQIKEGKVPEKLEKALINKPFTSFTEEEFLFRVPNVCNFWVRNGNEIIIETLGDSTDEVFLYFLSNALAATLFQRNIFPFHASSVIVNEEAVLFLAPSRTGKSSLAIQLNQIGYPIFTDDTIVLSVENGKCMATASYPLSKLWKSSIDKIEGIKDFELFRFKNEVEKFGFHFENDLTKMKFPVRKVVFLKEEGDTISILPIGAVKTLSNLIENSYRSNWIHPMKKGKIQFQYVSSLLPLIQGFEAIRPREKDTYKEFAEAIINEIFSK